MFQSLKGLQPKLNAHAGLLKFGHAVFQSLKGLQPKLNGQEKGRKPGEWTVSIPKRVTAKVELHEKVVNDRFLICFNP